MAKRMNEGGVRITKDKKSGMLKLAMGSDYAHDEMDALITDLVILAKRGKVAISAFIPGTKGDVSVEGSKYPGYSTEAFTKLAAKRTPVLLISFSAGFPAPFITLFDEKDKLARPKTQAKVSEFARKK